MNEPTRVVESSAATPQPEGLPEPSAEASAASRGSLTTVRPLLRETKSGLAAAKVERLAEELGQPAEEFITSLLKSGLRVPDKPREKPVFVEHAGEVLWLNRNAKGELWLNARVPKASDRDADLDEAEDLNEPSEGGEGEGEKRARRPSRTRAKKSEGKESPEEKVES